MAVEVEQRGNYEDKWPFAVVSVQIAIGIKVIPIVGVGGFRSSGRRACLLIFKSMICGFYWIFLISLIILTYIEWFITHLNDLNCQFNVLTNSFKKYNLIYQVLKSNSLRRIFVLTMIISVMDYNHIKLILRLFQRIGDFCKAPPYGFKNKSQDQLGYCCRGFSRSTLSLLELRREGVIWSPWFRCFES